MKVFKRQRASLPTASTRKGSGTQAVHSVVLGGTEAFTSGRGRPRVRRGITTRRVSKDPVAADPVGALEVVRCRGFGVGARESRRSDGSVQLRLPFGEWIVALKTADELKAERRRQADSPAHA